MVIPIVGSFYCVSQVISYGQSPERLEYLINSLPPLIEFHVNQPLYVGFRLYIPQAQKEERNLMPMLNRAVPLLLLS